MNILDTIIDNTRLEVSTAKSVSPLSMLKDMPGYDRTCLSLVQSLQTDDVAVIAEIKKASPSKEIIRENFHPVDIAQEYIQCGARALSVLTDRKYFHGDIRSIAEIRPLSPLPLLRKDFVIDSYQLSEAKAFGADAVLLIAAALAPRQLKELHAEANELGLECLVEVHHERELEALDSSQVRLLGVNNRDLTDFSVDVSTTVRVAAQVPKGITIVSESGIASRKDIDTLIAHGIHAVLVGESLLRQPSPGQALQALIGRQ